MAQQFTQQLPAGAPVPPGGADFVAGGPPGGFAGGPGLRGGLMFLPPPVMALLVVATFVLFAVGFWMIFRKAGYPGALGLLMALPIVNVVMLFYLALSEWPVLKQLREQRAISAMHAAEADASANDGPSVVPQADPAPDVVG